MNNYELGQLKWRENLEKRGTNRTPKPPSLLCLKRQFCKAWAAEFEFWNAQRNCRDDNDRTFGGDPRPQVWNSGKKNMRVLLDKMLVGNEIHCRGSAEDWATIEGYMPGYSKAHNKRFAYWWEPKLNCGVVRRLHLIADVKKMERDLMIERYDRFRQSWFAKNGIEFEHWDDFDAATVNKRA